jgi:hypothetical protein
MYCTVVLYLRVRLYRRAVEYKSQVLLLYTYVNEKYCTLLGLDLVLRMLTSDTLTSVTLSPTTRL